ncbi:MAG: rhodanese-like domain-containing protein [Ignavibacterium sp.]|nr:rhodanese-like domain-containing protein [Ignavibacterium sp.]
MDKKKILYIIFFSIIIGFTYNFLNPNGIPLIREERKLNFAEDDAVNLDSSLTFQNIPDILPNKNDFSEKDNKKENDSLINHSTKSKSSITVPFTKPLAIKIDKAYQLYKQGVKFIDARMPEEYTEGHIKGAINIPFDGDESYRNILNSFSKDEILVTYCSGTECDLSILLGEELFEKGFKRVYIFFGGWNDWVERNYPISKGKE